MKVSLIAATWNEIEGVRATLSKIDRTVVDEIIVVDGGSTDGTVEFCTQEGYTVFQQTRRGYGAAIREAIERAQGDLLIEFQPDGNSLSENVPRIVEKLKEGYDLVVGSRYIGGAKSYDDDALTRIGNRIFTSLTNILFGSTYSDALIGFRGFRRDAYKKLHMTADGLEWSIQLPIQFAKHRMKIVDIPADEPRRIGGVRKMRPFRTGLRILRTLLKERLVS